MYPHQPVLEILVGTRDYLCPTELLQGFACSLLSNFISKTVVTVVVLSPTQFDFLIRCRQLLDFQICFWSIYNVVDKSRMAPKDLLVRNKQATPVPRQMLCNWRNPRTL